MEKMNLSNCLKKKVLRLFFIKNNALEVCEQITKGEITFVANTQIGVQKNPDIFAIRRLALERQIAYATTIPSALAIISIVDYNPYDADVYTIQ